LALMTAILDQPPEYVYLAFVLSMLCVFTHRENIARLARGQEHRVGSS